MGTRTTTRLFSLGCRELHYALAQQISLAQKRNVHIWRLVLACVPGNIGTNRRTSPILHVASLNGAEQSTLLADASSHGLCLGVVKQSQFKLLPGYRELRVRVDSHESSSFRFSALTQACLAPPGGWAPGEVKLLPRSSPRSAVATATQRGRVCRALAEFCVV